MSGASNQKMSSRIIMPLVSRAFAPGMAREIIEAIEAPEEKEMAWAEYCLFTGKAEDAASRAEPFLTHADPALCLSANIVYCISNVTLGHMEKAQKILEVLESVETGKDAPLTGGYCADVVRVLLHLPETDPTNLDRIPSALPEGARFFLCYVLALREYLRGEHEKADGITAAALAMNENRYPIAEIYLHIISAISLMRRERLKEATGHFVAAWELALPDGLISPFGEHYVLLSGLNRKLIRSKFQEKYQEISKYADRYYSTWIGVHNNLSSHQVAPGLTKMESTVATLFSRGWSVKAIAQHLSVSNNTIKQHLSETYQKLGVNKREQLRDFLLR